VLLSYLYVVVSVLLVRVAVRTPSARAQTIELLALRHEVRVLRRQVQRTHWRPGDRVFLAALSRCLPRAEWWRLPVRPETLLRWHRELTRRKWAAFGQRRGPGRPLWEGKSRHRQMARAGYGVVRGKRRGHGVPDLARRNEAATGSRR
jgi:putative transposase